MNWTKESAQNYIKKVNKGQCEFGLKYLSACDFLRIPIPVAKSKRKSKQVILGKIMNI